MLLIAGGVGAPDEIPANRAYRDAGGPNTQLWELADTGHTGGLRTHPAEYERRTTAFLDRALGLKETHDYPARAALLIGVPIAFSGCCGSTPSSATTRACGT